MITKVHIFGQMSFFFLHIKKNPLNVSTFFIRNFCKILFNLTVYVKTNISNY